MPTITVPSIAATATELGLQLYLVLEDASWETRFDRLEVWRSRATDQGPYEPLTDDTWSPARLPAGVQGDPPSPALDGPSANVSGLTLSLLVNEETPLEITLTGVNPLTFGDVATQVEAQGRALLRSFVIGSRLVIETTQPGAAATLRIVGGGAAPLLGLPVSDPSNVAFGRDARLVLLHGVQSYTFTDLNGSPDFFYKTRYFNSTTRTASDFSIGFPGRTISQLAPSKLVRATVDLIDAKGIPLANRAILLTSTFKGSSVEGKVVVDAPMQQLTDMEGHVEFLLVRGQSFTVAVAGTNIVRDFSTPLDQGVVSFDMLDPAYSSDDVFNVQKQEINFASRRSL
jgi:hypothetical protein